MKKEKKDLYRFLGAEKFQKIVFLLENLKYKIIDKFFPNIKETIDQISDKKFLKKLKKEPLDNRKHLLEEHQNQKLLFHKELVFRQNRNYHYNPNYPTKFINYLEWNKNIHIKGMKKNIIILIVISSLIFFGNPMPIISIILIIKNLVSLIINFECVNLQNYNLERFKDKDTYSLFEKIEEKKKKENLEKLGESIKPVSKAITNQVELPTIDQVVSEITTIEQTRKLLEYAREQYMNMYSNESKRSR